jgi:hypothetical protein
MTTGLVIGEVAGFLTNMFWGNLIGLLAAVPLGAHLGRHGGLIGRLDGAMAGVMGGMMGAMLGVMLKFPPEHALITGVLLVLADCVALTCVAHLVQRTCGTPTDLPDYYDVLGLTPNATARDVAAGYLAATSSPGVPDEERLRLLDEALAILGDPLRRLAYDRARARTAVAAGPPPPQEAGGPPRARWPRPKTWGTMALVGLAIVGFNFVANRPVTCPAPATAAGLPSVAEPTWGKQAVNLTIQYPCYYPEQLTVQRGVPVELHIGTVGEPGCGRQVVMRGLGINTFVVPGQTKTVEFLPERVGTYTINCGMGMMKPATLRVTE